MTEGLFSVCHGVGPRRFLGLHGWSGDHRTFDPLLPFIPPDCRFCSIDLPGIGKSPLPRRWDAATIAGSIESYLVKSGEKNWTLIGNCSGAVLALMALSSLALKGQQDYVERVLLIDPFAYMPAYFRIFVSRYFGVLGWALYQLAFANPVGRMLVNQSLASHRSGTTDLTGSFSRVDHRVTYEYLRLLYEAGDASQFRGLSTRTEIVIGERSFRAVKHSADLFNGLLRDSSVQILEGAGHLPIEEATSAIAKLIFAKQESRI